tara:strand:- start:1192 stop:1788 length:597 start_codon:yes stop_codon:yes gene_type:complete
MKTDILGYIIIALIIILSVKLYYDSDLFQLKCIISNKDNNTYCVRERGKINEAADLLAETTVNMKKLVDHVKKKYPDRENVKRLVSKFNPSKIKETLPTSEYTAYSENKGEKLAFCLNENKKNNENLIDKNTLMFVALHEMAHIASKSVGHNDEFWYNFKFFIEESESIQIYKPIDYKKENKNYCGMMITDNPYYDLE